MGKIGTDASGSTMSVNSIDVMYAAFPVFLYVNPELAGYLLAPVLEYMGSSQFTLPYPGKNIGSTYPNATADYVNIDHDYGIEGMFPSHRRCGHGLIHIQKCRIGEHVDHDPGIFTTIREWNIYCSICELVAPLL